MTCQEEGTFPLLTAKELVQELPIVFPDLRFTMVDLRSPTADRMHFIYKTILKEIGVDVENQPCYSAYENTDHEYLLEEMFPFILLTNAIQETLKNIGASDFCVDDLLKPKTKRTRRFLSCFCNFIRFISSRSEFYNGRVQKAKDLRSKCDDKQKIISELEEQLKNQRKKLEDNDRQKTMLSVAFEAKREQLQQMTLTKVLKQKDTAKIKEENAELNAESENNVQRIQTLKELKEKHSRLIIKSPEKAFKTIDELKQEVEKLRKEKDTNHNRLFEMRKYIDNSKMFAVDLEHILVLLDQECEANKTHTELKTKAQVSTNKKELLKTQLQDTRVESEEGQRKMKIQAEGKSQTLVQCKAKLMSLHESSEQAKNDFHQLEQRKKENNEKLEILIHEKKNALLRKETICADTTARTKWMDETMNKITETVKDYSEHLVHKLDENQAQYDELFAENKKLE